MANNHIHYKVWDEIIYRFLNFNVDFRESKCFFPTPNFIPYCIYDYISLLGLKSIHVEMDPMHHIHVTAFITTRTWLAATRIHEIIYYCLMLVLTLTEYPTEPGSTWPLFYPNGIYCPLHWQPSGTDTPDPPLSSRPVSSAACGARPRRRAETQVYTHPPMGCTWA